MLLMRKDTLLGDTGG